MWKRLMTAGLIFGMAAAAPPLAAQSACGPHDRLIKSLNLAHGESAVGRGLQSSSRLYEVWRSSETGSWTILLVLPDGTACVMASGFAWIDDAPAPAGENS